MPVIYGNCEFEGFMSKCDLKSTTKSPSWCGVFFNDFFLSPLSLSLSVFFPPQTEFLSVAETSVPKTKQAQVKEQPAAFAAARGERAPSSTVVPAIAPDEGSAPEPVRSPLPDERQLWTGFGLFCLKTYH